MQAKQMQACAPGHVLAFGTAFDEPCAHGGARERPVRLRAARPAEDGAAACWRLRARHILWSASPPSTRSLHRAAAACAGAPAHARVVLHEGAQAEGVVALALGVAEQRGQELARRGHAATGRGAAQRQHGGPVAQRSARVACAHSTRQANLCVRRTGQDTRPRSAPPQQSRQKAWAQPHDAISSRLKVSKQMPHVRCRRSSARQAAGRQPQWGLGLREAVGTHRARRSRWRVPHLAAGVACALVRRRRRRKARSGAHGGLIL